jgi:hypothetical protein
MEEDKIMEHHHHCGCCGGHHEMGRRDFLAAMGGTALVGAALVAAKQEGAWAASTGGPKISIDLTKKELVVQPVLTHELPHRAPATSWRSWGGLETQADADQEANRITKSLEDLTKKAGFALKFLPIAKVVNRAEAEQIAKGESDVMLIYAAGGGNDTLEAMISPNRYNLLFLRHRSGPVYLYYETASCRLLRKMVDELGQPGLEPADVVVDETDDLVSKLRSLYALKNTLGSKVVVIGGPGGWGAGGQKAPQIAKDLWKLDLISVPYEDLGQRIQAAKADAKRVQDAEAAAKDYLALSGTTLKTDRGFVERAFLLTSVIENLMAESGAQAMTINNCMSTVMPMSETTACLPLSVINDSGALAFCESDFVVIPSGILLHHIAGTPVFLNDPTYPHHGMITVAHCTAPRKMDGKRLEKTTLLTHFESDYGAAPKVDMRIGQTITMIDPDFDAKRWIGFRGKVLENPFMPICRSQTDVSIEGDCDRLAREMVGFHWMLSYGDHLKEVGYSLRKLGIEWLNLSEPDGKVA